MDSKLRVGELVRIKPHAVLTGIMRAAGVRVGSVVRVQSPYAVDDPLFHTIEGGWYFSTDELERNPELRVGDHIRFKKTPRTPSHYWGKVCEVTELDCFGAPTLETADFKTPFIPPREDYELVPFNTPVTYFEGEAGSPEEPAAPLNGYREKLKGALIDLFSNTVDGGSEFCDGWNASLREVAAKMGFRLTYEPARVTCEDAA